MKAVLITIGGLLALGGTGFGANYYIKSELVNQYAVERDNFIENNNSNETSQISIQSSSFNGIYLQEKVAVSFLIENGEYSKPLVFDHKISFSLTDKLAYGSFSISKKEGLPTFLSDDFKLTFSDQGHWTYDFSRNNLYGDYSISKLKGELKGIGSFSGSNGTFNIDQLKTEFSTYNGEYSVNILADDFTFRIKDDNFSSDIVLSTDEIQVNTLIPDIEKPYLSSQDFTIRNTQFHSEDQRGNPRVHLIEAIENFSSLYKADKGVSLAYTMNINGLGTASGAFDQKKSYEDLVAIDDYEYLDSFALDLDFKNINENSLLTLAHAGPGDEEEILTAIDNITTNFPTIKLNELSSSTLDLSGELKLKSFKISELITPLQVISLIDADFKGSITHEGLQDFNKVREARIAVKNYLAVKQGDKYYSRFKFKDGEATLNGRSVRL